MREHHDAPASDFAKQNHGILYKKACCANSTTNPRSNKKVQTPGAIKKYKKYKIWQKYKKYKQAYLAKSGKSKNTNY